MAGTFTFVDLFAGVGGFHHALADDRFGGECVLAVERDEACRLVYQASFPEMADEQRFIDDVRDITFEDEARTIKRSLAAIREIVPEHDVLCAGFPCQPFSKSGAQHGIEDRTRGTLFFDILRIAKARHPRFLILENVPNLAGPRHTETWALIVASLREAGYRVSETPVMLSPHNLPKMSGGSPQVRTRVYILATYDPENAHENQDPLVAKTPFADFAPAVEWDIEAVLGPTEEATGYELTETELLWLEAWDEFLQVVEDDVLPGFPIWVDEWKDEPYIDPELPGWKQDFIAKNRAFYRDHRAALDAWRHKKRRFNGGFVTVDHFPPSRRKFEWQARLQHGGHEGRTLWDLVIHMRPSGIRVKPPTYVPALVAITQTSIIASQKRRLTPREAARLQQIPWEGFEKSGVSDKNAYKQLGNAVNVGAVQFVARALFASRGLDWGKGALDELAEAVASKGSREYVAIPIWERVPAQGRS